MAPLTTLKMKNDTRERKRLFSAGAMAHPAKGHIALWQEMVERYSSPGDWLLDPMAGIGTSLVAALMGRNVTCVEMEPHFVEPMKASWAKMQQHPMLGYTMGQAVILRGDARKLPLCSADAVLTSPPYEGSLQGDEPKGKLFETERRINSPASGNRKSLRKPLGQGYSKLEARAERVARVQGPGKRNVFQEALDNPGAVSRRGYEYGYTRPAAIVTSPPFQDQEPNHFGGETDFSAIGGLRHANVTHYENGDNIGNQRGEAYWASMRQVYAECWRVLRPGGILALVLKGFTRDGKYVDLPGQTEALLLAAGWESRDHFRRELWSLSFWRILQQQRDPAAFDQRLRYEEVLAVRKPGTWEYVQHPGEHLMKEEP